MGKVINITKKLNKKSKDSYYDRKHKCLSNIKKNGHCLCSSCKTINNLSDDVITFILNRYPFYEDKYKTNLYVGELEESLILSAKKFLDIIEKNYKEDE